MLPRCFLTPVVLYLRNVCSNGLFQKPQSGKKLLVRAFRFQTDNTVISRTAQGIKAVCKIHHALTDQGIVNVFSRCAAVCRFVGNGLIRDKIILDVYVADVLAKTVEDPSRINVNEQRISKISAYAHLAATSLYLTYHLFQALNAVEIQSLRLVKTGDPMLIAGARDALRYVNDPFEHFFIAARHGVYDVRGHSV